ncbi:Tar ligand binding domain-containing protein [Enterobacter kobei]|uniref:Tar ligand binding domain-containing protein n=1 Tax=Enterobacter kobei TaxID=208224 RepID=UPI00217511D4|nr:Tar ligand binding domain-containing protein [Enterobacter kobei]MCS4604468.1 Tar ligand binding domain-containing protein [Enterobacter kobei]
MLKNLHVITGIIFALTIFCLLQVVTGGLFYSAVSNDRHNFQNSGVLNAQQENLSDSVNTLVKTRVTVTRVTDIMGEISSASDEQSRGIEQVSLAVSQMDSVTQQNAALVQQSATAAAALEDQSEQLRQAVAAFRLNGKEHAVTSRPANVKTPQLLRPATANATPDSHWETF